MKRGNWGYRCTITGVNTPRVAFLCLWLWIAIAGWHPSWAAAQETAGCQDRVIRDWIEDLRSSRPEVREAAAVMLGNMGPKANDAVPALCRALKDRHPLVQKRVAKTLGRIGSKEAVPALIEAITYKYYGDPRWAIWALGKIGPEAKAAIPALMDTYLHDRNLGVLQYARDALVGMGEAAVGPLVQILEEEEDWGYRCRVACLLGSLGPKANRAVPALVRCLEDRHEDLRAGAVLSLGQIGPMAKDAVSALRQILRDRAGVLDNIETVNTRRCQAAEALGKIGPGAKAAIPDLMEAWKDKSPGLRARAAEALQRIDPEKAAKAGVR